MRELLGLPPNHLPLRFPVSLPHSSCPTFINLLFFSFSSSQREGDPVTSPSALKTFLTHEESEAISAARAATALSPGELDSSGLKFFPQSRSGYKEKPIEPCRGHTTLTGEGGRPPAPGLSVSLRAVLMGVKGTLSFSIFPRGFETAGGARVPGGAGTQR